MEPQKQVNLAKNKSKNNKVESINLDAFLSIQSKQQLKKAVANDIKGVTYKQKQNFESKLRQATKNRYHNKETNKIEEQNLPALLDDIERINAALKQGQVSTPIVEVFNSVFIQYLKQAQSLKIIKDEQLLSLWESIPFRNLEHFLENLSLRQAFKNQNQQKFTKILIGYISDSKILQSCVYYMLYKPIPNFEKQVLIPKILITDQIYNQIISDLFKKLPHLKQQVINQIDPPKAVIILEHLEQDPRKYQRLNKFILRKHYLSMIHEYPEWYVFEDKMSFNPVFLQEYCKEQNISQDVKQSIRFRNGLGGKEEIVPNPLYKYDSFTAAEEILAKWEKEGKGEKKQQDNGIGQKYVKLIDYGITENDVYFVGESNSSQYEKMVETLMPCEYVGFDAQYRCTSTKYEQIGVAIIQISTGKQIYLIDFLKLDSDPKFVSFFSKLLSNPKFVFVGHSVQSDIKFIQRTMKIQAVEGVVDIAKLFKQKFPNQTQNSLAFMTNFMVGKHMSKYEQRSNWNRRPLKKTQTHYAALDAQMCLVLYEILKGQQIKLTQAIVKNKKNTIEKLIRKENIVYKQQHENLLVDDHPKFLIDSMLKRLCSLLRNLGLDAQYVAVSNFEHMQQIATKEGRIILTRDRKLLSKKSPKMPIYCITEKGDSDLMLQEIKKQFHIDFSLFKPLSRCVKCNCAEIQLIDKDEALKYVNFQYEDTKIQEFWRCMKCRQIYWQGNQWKNAKKKFQNM